MEKDIYKDLRIEFERAEEKIRSLEAENSKLKDIIKENDLEDEIGEDISFVSVEEQICIDGIKHIAELVKTHQYDDKDVKNFDTLFKVLRQIKGQSVPEKKGKKVDIADALKVVNGMKE
jgi:hypothetical protein